MRVCVCVCVCVCVPERSALFHSPFLRQLKCPRLLGQLCLASFLLEELLGGEGAGPNLHLVRISERQTHEQRETRDLHESVSVCVRLYTSERGGARWLCNNKLCFLPMSPRILLEVRDTVLQNASKQPWLSFLEQRETLH